VSEAGEPAGLDGALAAVVAALGHARLLDGCSGPAAREVTAALAALADFVQAAVRP
jgi:hypothetical protein